MGGEVREGGFTVALTHSLRRRVSYQRLVILEQMRTIMTSLLTRNATPRRIQLYTMWRESTPREQKADTHPPSLAHCPSFDVEEDDAGNFIKGTL